MDRTKVLAVALAIVTAGAASLLLAGGASAASWHLYEGDIHAGHAYGLQVPADAESLEIQLSGEPGSAASLALYSPAGDKVGHYALSDSLTSAGLAAPEEGRYVIYVYEITAGALNVRVQATSEPFLDLQKMPMQRQDLKLGSFEPGALDKIVSAEFPETPVFVTLLYEGSAQGLDATVASDKGSVITIADETATAFSPGVWTTYAGTRTVDAANLGGLAYSVEVHADDFEGTLILTGLAVDFSVPVAQPEAPETAAEVPTLEWDVASHGVFALPEKSAVAFHATAGTLVLTDPEAVEEMEEASKDNESSYGDYRHHGHFRDVLALYAPDDSLLAYVEITDDEPIVEIELPVDGEYVAFVHRASNDVVLAKMAGVDTKVEVRQLELVEETFEFEQSAFLQEEVVAFDIERMPVDMKLRFGDDSVGALNFVQVSNEEGVVAYSHDLATTPGGDWFQWYGIEPENFRAGEHELHVGGVFEGTIELTSFSYDRALTIEEPAVEPEEPETPEEPEEPEHPEEPSVPTSAPVLSALRALLFG